MADRAEKPRFVDWPYVIGLALLPVIVMLVLVGLAFVQGLRRFDPVYFSPSYQERYASPGSVAIALERALREGDEQLMAELLATRRSPGEMQPRPSLIFIFLLGIDGDYFQYLYLNTNDYNRVIQYVTQQDGRYVVSRADLHYYLDSGRWTGVVAPIAATWWILVAVYTAAAYVYRRMAAERKRMYDR